MQVGDIVNHKNSVSASIIPCSYSTILFCARRVPNLQVYTLPVFYCDNFVGEFDADGNLCAFLVGFFHKTLKYVALADIAVASNYYFEQHVIFRVALLLLSSSLNISHGVGALENSTRWSR
jgi:hypothetical protein